MKRVVPFLIIIVCLGCWQFYQMQKSMTQLKTELNRNRELVRERQSQLDEMRGHPVELPDDEEMQRLAASRRELIRLRGEYTRYHSIKDKTSEELEREIAETKAKAKAVFAETRLVSNMDKAKKERETARNVIQTVHHLLRTYHQEKQRSPVSIEELAKWIESLPGQPVEKAVLFNISETDEFRHLTWKGCEILGVGTSDAEGKALPMIREKAGRHLPDDSVSRLYVSGSGQLHEVLAPSQQFGEKESAFLSSMVE